MRGAPAPKEVRIADNLTDDHGIIDLRSSDALVRIPSVATPDSAAIVSAAGGGGSPTRSTASEPPATACGGFQTSRAHTIAPM